MTEPVALKTLIDELRKNLGAIKKFEGNDLTVKIKIGYRLRNEEGITDENMYSVVLDELIK